MGQYTLMRMQSSYDIVQAPEREHAFRWCSSHTNRWTLVIRVAAIDVSRGVRLSHWLPPGRLPRRRGDEPTGRLTQPGPSSCASPPRCSGRSPAEPYPPRRRGASVGSSRTIRKVRRHYPFPFPAGCRAEAGNASRETVVSWYPPADLCTRPCAVKAASA